MISIQFKTARSVIACGFVLAWSGWGCLSMQSQTSLDTVNTSAVNAAQPFVEGYVEYPGPQAKWSGPASFIVHVTAKDAGDALITTIPALLSEVSSPGPLPSPPTPPELSQRTPAASILSQSAVFKKMTSMEAREQLTRLASALQGAQAPFKGCLSPVRVRLVKADGVIVEKQGCRSELGWSRAVSEAVSSFVDASVHGMAAPQLAPQSGPRSVQNQGHGSSPSRSVAGSASGSGSSETLSY